MKLAIRNFLLFFLIAISLSFFACEKKASNVKTKRKVRKQITILTLDRIKNSSYFQHILPVFEADYGCAVNIVSVAGSDDLKKEVDREREEHRYDVIFGMDNCFFAESELHESMAPNKALKRYAINKTFIFDAGERVVPYGYGYLSMLYNEIKVTEPPESFGELQDSRFFNQITVCDPRSSGIGRATLYWSLALFGESGYQQFWRSIKKNIYTQKSSWQEAVFTLNNQESGMIFGFTSTPAWILESTENALPIKASLMKEGSFLYVEAAAITKKARHKPLADALLSYILSPEAQKFVAYDLGLFPSNESTPLPANFASTPFTTFTVNDRLKAENPISNLESWLGFWDKLFSLRVF
jgi:thiamine transport system substrate-binding protein